MLYLVLILTSVLWGLAPIAIKIALWEMPPFTLSFFRFFVAFLILLPIFYLKKEHLPKGKNFFRLVLSTSLMGLNVLFFAWGMQFTTAITASLLYASVPILVAIGNSLFFKEKVSLSQILGTSIAFMGMILLLFSPLIEKGSRWEVGTLLGNVVIVLATLAFTAYTLDSRRLSERFSPFSITVVSILTSLLLFSIFSPFELAKDVSWVKAVTPRSVLAVFYLGAGASLATIFLYQWVIKSANAFVASLFVYLQPVITVIAGAILLKEKITSTFTISASLIILGVFIATNLKYLDFKKVRR